jgi:hypothetical protein
MKGGFMLRKKVNSSRIKSIGWENETLEVEFKNGAIYHYYKVTEYQYRIFCGSSSLGSALEKIEKQHKYKKIYTPRK